MGIERFDLTSGHRSVDRFITSINDLNLVPYLSSLVARAHPSVSSPQESLQVEICDSKAGAELLDIILMKEGPVEEIFAAQVAASPPFFRGSPPMRVANPLIRDDRFGCEKPTCASP